MQTGEDRQSFFGKQDMIASVHDKHEITENPNRAQVNGSRDQKQQPFHIQNLIWMEVEIDSEDKNHPEKFDVAIVV